MEDVSADEKRYLI